jgi:hypothetical protein
MKVGLADRVKYENFGEVVEGCVVNSWVAAEQGQSRSSYGNKFLLDTYSWWVEIVADVNV